MNVESRDKVEKVARKADLLRWALVGFAREGDSDNPEAFFPLSECAAEIVDELREASA